MDSLYDETGVQYKVPIYCCANPIELCGDSPAGGAGSAATPGSLSAEQSPSKTSSLTAASSGKMLNLKIRINPGKV